MRIPLTRLCLFATAAAAAAGCGSSEQPARPPSPSVGDGARDAITILAPADGVRLRASAAGEDALRASVRVRGRARPGSAVFLNAGCRPLPCRARVAAGAQGTWRATIALRVPRAAPFVTIDAASARDGAGAGAGTAVATVELVAGPAPSRRPPRPPQPQASSPRAKQRAPAATRPSRPALPHDVLVIGDSLAEGMAAPLRAALPGWRVRIEALTGRPLAAGMRILGAEPGAPAILAMSLFTNDEPRNTAALEAAVRATATRPGGCAVWSTIVRPPYEGVSYAAANALLHRLARDPEVAPGLELVEWERAARQTPSLVSGDEVHASPQGYRTRALMYAEAIRACAGER
jgi:hypothetical protein